MDAGWPPNAGEPDPLVAVAEYNRALENPQVQVTMDGEKGAYMAVPVTDEEHDRVNAESPLGMIRILMGFPPRYFVRLDPR